jgi:uncharacterized protein (TIGR03437 family)
VKFHIFAFLAVIILLSNSFIASAQVDSVIGQVTSSATESFAGGISGDGRFIVFESTGDHGTERVDNQPNNADGNREIFLFDYAQRRIFQITNTKSLLTDPTKAPTVDNIKVNIVNVRPVISNDGRWIAFGSNATCAFPGPPTIVSATNPGAFDPNATTGNDCLTGTAPNQTNNLVNDGNTEMWLYAVPPVAPVENLSAGDEIPLTNLAGGAFTRVTNTRPSRLPVPGSTTTFPVIADDNYDASIDDTGAAISFTSNRDLAPCQPPTATCGNASPNDNDEIFAFRRDTSTTTQVTATVRGTIARPIYNAASTITNLTDGGWRVAFTSRANTPIPGMTGSNADNNEEIFYANLTSSLALGTNHKQVTTTTQTNPGDVVNILDYGRRMSRDGRYIAFDSYADLTNEHGGTNQPGFATFIYDVVLNDFERILPRSNADAGAAGGDIQRYPGFTDYDANRSPKTIVMETRMNIRASDGTIPTNADEGLNNVAARPAQIYSTTPAFIPTPTPPATRPARPFKRLTKLPVPSFVLASIQPIPSNSVQRMVFNLAQTETGSGNTDLASEVYYFLLPEAVPGDTAASFNFATGASRIPISASPVPTPSPTATPTPTPTGSPTPTPSPTPQQPSAVQGASPGMLVILDYNSGINTPVVARTAVGSLERRFTLPIELSGVTVTVNGAAAGIKSVGLRQIVFVVPPALAAASAGTEYPVVVNNNGVILRGKITLVPARPDIFTDLPTPGPGGRARVFNATNRVLTREPFTVRTFRLRGSRLVPSVLRLYLTGVNDTPPTITPASSIIIRIGSTSIAGATVLSGARLVEPGVYTVDFQLPPDLAGAGDQPIVVEVTINGVVYSSRLQNTAPRIFIL